MRNSQPILVIGATGQQGGAVARELLRRGHPVRALTRQPDGDAAKRLAADGAVVVAGDLADRTALASAMSGVGGVFSVQPIFGPHGPDLASEVRHGIAVAEVARELEVAHVVYSSVGGAERDSGVPHFESKWTIERRLQELAVPTTVLRPVFFMENFLGMPPARVDDHLVVRLALPADRPLQMVATADIGVFAADAFEQPEAHLGRALELAGDELTGTQIAQSFQEITGLPTRYKPQPLAEVQAFSDDLARMFDWFDRAGYRADIPALRQRHPGLRTLTGWLREVGWTPAETR